jgi:hypothetical protein
MQEGENPSTLTGINSFYRVFSLLFEKWNNKKRALKRHNFNERRERQGLSPRRRRG